MQPIGYRRSARSRSFRSAEGRGSRRLRCHRARRRDEGAFRETSGCGLQLKWCAHASPSSLRRRVSTDPAPQHRREVQQHRIEMSRRILRNSPIRHSITSETRSAASSNPAGRAAAETGPGAAVGRQRGTIGRGYFHRSGDSERDDFSVTPSEHRVPGPLGQETITGAETRSERQVEVGTHLGLASGQ